MKGFKQLIPYVVIIIIVIVIRTYLISPARVNGDSMESTLYDKEIVFVNKYVHHFGEYKRFDIIVIKENKEYLIKRIIGFEGETIKYENNILYIDNKEIETPFDFEYTENFEATVDEDSVFVLGDNRNVSKDSRYFGSFKISDLRGTVTIRIFPFNKISKIK